MKRIKFALLFFLFFSELRAQCLNGFSLGNDTALCANQNLSLSVSNVYDQYTWNNNSSANSLLVTDPGTYYCTTSQVNIVNLVVNGNFELGNTAFTTDYTFYPIADVFGPQASYGIINNPNTWFNPFDPCTDHSSGSGNMMVVDGSAFNGGNDAIWCQNIPVQAGKNYKFSYWIQSVTSSNILANIRVKVNGATVSTNLAPNGACLWQERTVNIIGAASGTVNICLYDLQLAGNGNDFALDDISLREICRYTDTIVVDYTPIDTITNQVALCSGDSIFLENAWQTLPGSYYDIVPGINCDEVLETLVQLQALDTSYTQLQICMGDSAFLSNAWQQQAGFYYDVVSGPVCDEILETQLSFYSTDTSFAQITICPGDSAFLSDAWQQQAGFYYDVIPGLVCNDVLATELLWYPVDASYAQVEICKGDSSFLAGSWQTAEAVYYDFVTAFPCSEVLATQLSWFNTDTTRAILEICLNDSAFLEGEWRKVEGVYYDQEPGLDCDGVLETSLVFKEQVQAFAGNDVTSFYEDTVTLTANDSLPFTQYFWWSDNGFTSTNQSINVEVGSPFQLYYLQLTQDGCQDVDSVYVFGIPLNLRVWVPSAFSPNLDGINELFRVINKDEFQSINMKIYDRWGALIYYEEGKNPSWTGTYASGVNCPISTYVYYIEANPYGESESLKLSGVLSLIR